MKKGLMFKKIAFTMILTMILTSCGKVEKEDETYDYPVYVEENNEQIDQSEQNNQSEQSEPQLTEREKEELRLEKISNAYSEYFDTYAVNYNYINAYLSKEKIDEIVDCSNIETHCERGYELDPELFFDILKENSEKYVSEHREFRFPFVEEYYKDHAADFETNLMYTLETIIYEKNDVYEDLHQIEGLTILFGDASKFLSEAEKSDVEERYYLVYASEDDSFLLGVYDSYQNIIVIDDENISLIVSMYYDEEEQRTKFNELLLEALQHEFNHARAKACPCRIEQGLLMDNMFVYDGSYISTISEAAAESELYVMGKYPYNYSMQFDDYVYQSERADELLLLTLALCNEDANIEDYYNAIFDTNYAALYDFYDLRSREDIYDFYNIVYSIDSKNFRNNLWERVYSEEELEEKTYFDYNVDIGYAYRVDIFRMVLEKLVEYTNNEGVRGFALKDNLAVFNFLKAIVVKDSYMYYEDDTDPENIRYRKYYEEYMVENIIILENKYVEFLSKYYRVSVSDIRHMENTEIQEYAQVITNVANYKYTDKKTDKEAISLIADFPILRMLLRKNYVSYYDYPNFVEDNENYIYK